MEVRQWWAVFKATCRADLGCARRTGARTELCTPADAAPCRGSRTVAGGRAITAV